jgi:hypothetical protein
MLSTLVLSHVSSFVEFVREVQIYMQDIVHEVGTKI